MKWSRLLLPVVAVLAFAPHVQSQTLIAQYFRCSTADEGEADFIVNEVLGDIYQRHADSGDIMGWGWVEHLTGGQWRRIMTFTGPDLASAWDAWGSIVEAITDEHPNAWHRFNEICPSHDDYIWNLINTSYEEVAGTPDMWASTYWVCDSQRESRADEIFEEITPVFEQHMTAGHIGGYSWYGHEVGGRFRRLMTIGAADDFNLLEGRQMVSEDLQANHGELLEEFGDICGGHVDYIWANAGDAEDEEE